MSITRWSRAPEHARHQRIRWTKRHRGYIRPLAQLGMYRCSCHGDLYRDVLPVGEAPDKHAVEMESLDPEETKFCTGMR